MLAPLLLAVLMATSVLTTFITSTRTRNNKYVALQRTPHQVYPGCTPVMTLKCSINTTSATTSGMGLLGETPATVGHVNALILKKEGVIIASVTYADSVESYSPANSYSNNTNMAVGGSLLGNGEECGFLELTWTDPMFSLNGTYECVANGIDDMGEQVSFSVTAGVIMEGAKKAQITALNTQITNLLVAQDSLTEQISELENSLAECKAPTTSAPTTLETTQYVETTTLAPTTPAPTTTAPKTTPCAPTATSLARQPATVDGIPVLCDTETDGGNWIIIQRRTVGDMSFEHNWTEYEAGFGNVTGDHWLGLTNIHYLCNVAQPCVVRFDMEFNGNMKYEEYSSFYLGDAADKFRLHVSGPSGTAGNSLIRLRGSNANLMRFSTQDQDNDAMSGDCAALRGGAWWYRDCSRVNLNGEWGATGNTGMFWYDLTVLHSVTSSEIKIRRQ